jgi:hypothetical protein
MSKAFKKVATASKGMRVGLLPADIEVFFHVNKITLDDIAKDARIIAKRAKEMSGVEPVDKMRKVQATTIAEKAERIERMVTHLRGDLKNMITSIKRYEKVDKALALYAELGAITERGRRTLHRR